MKSLLFALVAGLLIVSCQAPVEKQYFSESSDIDLGKKLMNAYLAQDWDAYPALYADTARIWRNKNWTKDEGFTVQQYIDDLKTQLETTSSYKFDPQNWEGIISNDIIYEFTRNGKAFTYRSEAGSTVLSGSVLSVTTRSISRQSVHNAQEQRVTVTISLRMTDPEGVVIWQAPRISENEDYEVAEDKGTTEQNKRAAITKLSRRLAEKVYYQMTDNF